MGKDEVLDALVGLETAASKEALCAQFIVIHEALSDIERKRWKFLEDACFSVLRNVYRLFISDNDDNTSTLDSQKASPTQEINLCLQFLEPLIDSTVNIVDALDDEQEAAGQRGVLVAALLYLFAKGTKRKDIQSRLVSNVLKCGVDIHVLFSTLRFREELVQCQRLLTPPHDSDSEESETEDDGEMLGETIEFKSEDTWWITAQVAKRWGVTNYQYFLATSGQEYAFAAWSCAGIASFGYTMLTDERYGNALSAIVSPFSWLFLLASFAHSMLISEDQEERFRGLEVLRVAVDLCPQRKLALRMRDATLTRLQSFRGQEALFCERNWITPLIQVQTNAMVSFPEANRRAAALTVLKEFVSKLVDADRFWILRDLIVDCPYGNVAAILVDFVRSDTVQAWSSSDTLPQSPYKTPAICSLLEKTLARSAGLDLVLHADLTASCLSLFRFLYIRDQDDTTGIRIKTNDIRLVLMRISKRLQLMIQESMPGTKSGSVFNDLTHLTILEASLCSTLELCNLSR